MVNSWNKLFAEEIEAKWQHFGISLLLRNCVMIGLL